MKTDKEIKERISLIDDKIFHLENLLSKDDTEGRKKAYSEMMKEMIEEKFALKWVLNK